MGHKDLLSFLLVSWIKLIAIHWKCKKTLFFFFFFFFQIEVEFIASDGTANTVHSPIINVCACQNQGVCVQESSDESNLNNNTEKFTFLFCNCLNGYTGSFCEADLDACDENFQPCFPGVSCIDSPPPANASGYTCGPCPSGYSGDGAECSGMGYL